MNSMMEYKGYHATFNYDAEDNLFIGKVHGLSDSLNFHGSSIEELTSMFHQSVDNYLDICKKIGKNPEKEYSGTFNVRLPAALHRKVAETAHSKGETINSVIKTAVEEYLRKDEITSVQLFCPYAAISKNNPEIENEYIQSNEIYVKEALMQWQH